VVSEDAWLEKISTKNLKVNDKLPKSPQDRVLAGYKITHTSQTPPDPNISTDIELIHDEETFMVINKPSPLPIHPCGRFRKNTLITILKLAFPETDFKPTHRIDANTTGIIIIAKTKKTATKIMRQFEKRTTQKEYLALVNGIIKEDRFVCNAAIGTEKLSSGGRRVELKGEKAETNFKVIERFHNKNLTLVLAKPKTGRTNQIRIHLSHLGYSILGDNSYDNVEYLEENPLTYDTDKLFLHSYSIELAHPITGLKVKYTAPIPSKYNELYEKKLN
jgi:23S rRNA pseudouridine1911/1915/1917 synthase